MRPRNIVILAALLVVLIVSAASLRHSYRPSIWLNPQSGVFIQIAFDEETPLPQHKIHSFSLTTNGFVSSHHVYHRGGVIVRHFYNRIPPTSAAPSFAPPAYSARGVPLIHAPTNSYRFTNGSPNPAYDQRFSVDSRLWELPPDPRKPTAAILARRIPSPPANTEPPATSP
jgi:hypothetical protein